VFVIFEDYKRYAAKMMYMPSLSRRALYQINQLPHGIQSENSAMHPSPDKFFCLRIYTRNQASVSSDDGLNLQLGSLPIECRLDYVTTRMAGISAPYFQVFPWKS
jgi:hypothetical protein